MTCDAPSPAVEIRDAAALGELTPEWQGLLERTYDNRFFLTPHWARIWWDHFGVGEAKILTLSEGGTLQALLPLQIVERGGRRILTLLGSPAVSDYMDGLAEREGAQKLLNILWQRAAELTWDRIELRHVPSSSPLVPALRSVDGLEVRTEEDEVCPVAILCKDWDGYLQTLSKKQRHEIRRKLRRAQEGSDWSYRITSTREELDADLTVFFRLHEASAHEKARFMTADMRAYFRALASALLDEGCLRLGIFRRNGVDVAATMSFVYRNRYLLYNSGYDPAYAANSPGIAAVSLAMQDAIELKAVAFDFLSGNEPYKYQFGATNTYTCRTEAERG